MHILMKTLFEKIHNYIILLYYYIYCSPNISKQNMCIIIMYLVYRRIYIYIYIYIYMTRICATTTVVDRTIKLCNLLMYIVYYTV